MAKQPVTLIVNGDRFELAIDPWRTLAEVLREDLRLVGTKVGCNQGDCGACTVLLEGRSVCSCMTLAVEADELAITTIEGIAPAPDRLHPLQQSFIDKGAIQCGFCTAGMIVSATSMLTDEPRPDEARIRHGIDGNLCRCTGYYKIVDAIVDAAEQLADGEPTAGQGGRS